jgi:SnoaL-like domain
LNDTERLLAIEEIKVLKARYFRCVDTKDWGGFEALCHADVVLDISADVPGGVITGIAKILEMMKVSLAGVTSVHHGHCPEIEFTSDTTAAGIWAMEDVLRFPEVSAFPIKSLHGYGHYIETYERLGGRWRFKTIKLTRMRVDIEPTSAESENGAMQ